MRCKFAIIKKTVVAIIVLFFAQTESFNQEMAHNDSATSVVIDFTKANHWQGTLLNLGKSINSSFAEYAPRIATDGKTLYFCRKIGNVEAEKEFEKTLEMSLDEFVQLSDAKQKKHMQKLVSELGQTKFLEFLLKVRLIDGHEDIFVSHLENGEWTEAQNVGSSLNTTTGNEAPESISTDNNQLFVFKDGDVYISQRAGNDWGSLSKIEGPVNSSAWDADICFSSDGRSILFSSQRAGYTKKSDSDGKNIDIWVTTKIDSVWSEPVNLGPAVNTSQNDRTPFLHSDGRTLYFASDGHSSQGGFDIFKTTRPNDSTWAEWSEPVNLTSLNSSDDDWDLTMPANSEWAFFTSSRAGGEGKYDIYKYKVDDTVRPEKSVTLISGIVTDISGKPLAADVRWENLDTGELLGVAVSNVLSGEYTIALPEGYRYAYYATKENYWDKSDNIDLTESKNYKELKINIELHPIAPPSGITEDKKSDITVAKKSEEIPLKNIFFEFNSFTLDATSHSELNRLAEKLNKHTEVNIQIEGHTDDVGTAEYNMVLSQNRAEAVRNYLILKGVDGNRITAIGCGKTRPIADNKTEDGRQQNRRVQFVEVIPLTSK